MKIALFGSHAFERLALDQANRSHGFSLHYLDARLTAATAPLAADHPVVSAFANDDLSEPVIRILAKGGTRLLALRSAGYNHVDLKAAAQNGIRVVRVPAYSPHAVAEHAVAMLLTLNRKTHRAFNRVREGNFSLEGLMGFDLHGKTVGVAGTGKIGVAFLEIMRGFGCRLLAYDQKPDHELSRKLGVEFVSLERLCQESAVVSLHLPLNPQTRHIIGPREFALFRPGTILVNTGRGGLIDSKALVAALKQERLGGACLDVYEEESAVFFADHSGEVIKDDVLARLLTFPNVLITAHQAFLTREAVRGIAETTLANVAEFSAQGPLTNEVKA
jgi:D-lactate dehydrogenase